ncbi:transglycosylase SLT domain-containing protein [Nonomuraea jiangxiensis]|uniref:C40 family peptidase n=1 Tax=Nonomuraea jiangxiensis TaxID=633440 RepID=UPI0015A0F5ED|nr:transglycosylase SLT domain-containing protein [Nonomuraea jiangxiensis]
MATAAFLALLIGLVLLLSSGPPGSGPPLALRPGSVPAAYQAWVSRAGRVCPQVSPPLIAAQVEAESGWRPTARSSVGAQGMAQFMPATWASYGRDADGDGVTSPDDPEDAIMAMARYDCTLARTVASLPGDTISNMLAAYNAGPGAVLRHKGIPQYPETQEYVRRVLSRVAHYTDTSITAIGAARFGSAVVATAQRWLGTPYAWGGGGPNGPTPGIGRATGIVGFDCSGLVLHAVWAASGGRVQLPHLAATQATEYGTAVSRDQLLPGDVIGIDHRDGLGISHIVIYVGRGEVIHAPRPGDVVRLAPLSAFASAAWTIRRYA